MKVIRPYELFDRLNDDERDVMYRIPQGASGKTLSVSSLDTLVLVALARIHDVETILEIGTAWGWTAYNLSQNTHAQITTVDIEDKQPKVYSEGRVSTVICPSSEFPPEPTDMIIVDGDHSRAGVSIDTKLAFACNPKVIVWHDYKNPNDPENTQFLDELSETMDLFHVGDSNFVVWEKS